MTLLAANILSLLHTRGPGEFASRAPKAVCMALQVLIALPRLIQCPRASFRPPSGFNLPARHHRSGPSQINTACLKPGFNVPWGICWLQ
jgi:hypothetical protein